MQALLLCFIFIPALALYPYVKGECGNYERLKLSLKGLSPVEYRTQALKGRVAKRPGFGVHFNIPAFHIMRRLTVPVRQSMRTVR